MCLIMSAPVLLIKVSFLFSKHTCSADVVVTLAVTFVLYIASSFGLCKYLKASFECAS